MPGVARRSARRADHDQVVAGIGQGYPLGHLAGRRALVFTTSNTPRDAELALYGDPLENLWKTCIFGLCGLTEFRRRNFESIVMSTPEQRRGWLDDARRLVAEMFPAG